MKKRYTINKARVWLIIFLTGFQAALDKFSPFAWAYVFSQFITKFFKL